MIDTPKRKTLYLLDGPNLAFRAFYAIGGMANSKGLPTNALFGFTNMLLKLIREHRPDYLAIRATASPSSVYAVASTSRNGAIT